MYFIVMCTSELVEAREEQPKPQTFKSENYGQNIKAPMLCFGSYMSSKSPCVKAWSRGVALLGDGGTFSGRGLVGGLLIIGGMPLKERTEPNPSSLTFPTDMRQTFCIAPC
jgi:hypothetical protein